MLTYDTVHHIIYRTKSKSTQMGAFYVVAKQATAYANGELPLLENTPTAENLYYLSLWYILFEGNER